MNMEEVAIYPEFRASWLAEIETGNPSATEKGKRFAWKLVNDWLELPDDAVVHYCDGPRDGGIDLAILQKGETEVSAPGGDTWYIVQSKYGSAWKGEDTAIGEGVKVISTLSGDRQGLSDEASKVCRKLQSFRENLGENDRMVLTFAKLDPPDEGEQRALDHIRKYGREVLGMHFDVEVICVRTIHDRLVARKRHSDEESARLTVNLNGSFAHSVDSGLLVGVAPLVNLYKFLSSYQSLTQNIDQIYEHNVRRFLGGRVKVNKEMRKTLQFEPELFGLYNNGITIVVSDVVSEADDEYGLVNPYVVNGCQTTQSIWDVLDDKLGAGGTGEATDETWRRKLDLGVVIVKIAKASGDANILRRITRFTNSQNAIRERDFIALDRDFREWQRDLEQTYDIYLEIQRGGWDSRKALQKQNPEMKQLSRVANAHDLLKIYGAGWLSYPGVAFSGNQPFLPNGSVYKQIMKPERGRPFGVDDLFAAFLLQEASNEAGYGRGAKKASRGLTRFLFAFVTISLLRDALQKEEMEFNEPAITSALVSAMTCESSRKALTDLANMAIDRYLQVGAGETLFEEELFEHSNNDVTRFLKREQLGKNLDETPHLRAVLGVHQQLMEASIGGGPSMRDTIMVAIKSQSGEAAQGHGDVD